MMLTQKSMRGASLHYSTIGKCGGTDTKIDLAHDLYVCSPLSAGFVRCISGGVYCSLLFCVATRSSTSLDVSLSSLCSLGLNPRCSQYLYTSLYAPRSSSFFPVFYRHAFNEIWIVQIEDAQIFHPSIGCAW